MLLFPGQPFSRAGRYSVSMSGELTIRDVHSEDSGYYVCQAISVAGSVVSKALLEVKAPSDLVPPIIRQGPANQTLARGSSVLLQCHVTGSPPPSIRWEKDGQSLLGDDIHISLMENGTLHISDLQETDSGTYTCVASSSTGEMSWSGTVTVRTGTSSVPRISLALQLPGPPQKPVVTDVSQSSVTLTWQPNQHEGGAAVTSYIIEAFQSVGSTWQTVADQVKQEKHTVSGLYPNTVYLFIVRAVNSYGLSDPSPISEPVRTLIDHRRIQTDFAEVTVYLHPPEILTPTSVQITWTAEREPQYIQGYRLLYRPVGSAWLVQDIKAGPKHTAVLSDLHRGTDYELKMRPYFKEFQGSDSDMVLVRTPEELSGPPQTVSVVQLSNSSTLRVSWEPPVTDGQDEPVLEYRVWCAGNESGLQYMNRSVDGDVLWALLDGLVPELLYRVQVVAVTGSGIGTPSRPVFIFLPVGEPSLPADDSISLSEQISGVVRQPAFIAGLGGASWMVLMGFSAWIYCRHRRRKELGHYATSFAYTPAGLSHSDGSGLINGPCLLGSNMGNYPWLAESWPTSNFTHTSKDSMTCCSGQHDSTDRYYNVGITNFLKQSNAYSPTSNEGPIYSTINPADEEQHDLSSLYSQGPDPYSSSPALSKTDVFGLDHDLDQWSIQSGNSTTEYAKLQYPSEDDEDWCPPLPERTYLFESLENSATLPLRGEQTGRGTTYSQRPTTFLTPSPHEERRPANSRLPHPDLLPSKPACSLGSQIPLSHPNLLSNQESHSGSLPHLTGHWRDVGQLDRLLSDNEFASFSPEKSIPSPNHQQRPKRKSPRDGRRREILKPGLPPPPEPPPAEDSLKQLAAMLESGSRTPPSRQERRAERRAASQWSAEEELIQYCKMNMTTRSQVSSHCSSTGSPSSRSSTSSRSSGAARRRNE
uniref:Roundabout guidance receptor 3 n=1 Tax=Astyanax mexicanus TaxID=7994 RepID=W5K6H6_ASTMX